MNTLELLLRPLGAAALLYGSSLAQTVVPPGLILSGNWTQAGSPYLVGGDISVLNLTISPGVRVEIQGHYSISVQGTLVASGDASAPITFTSATASTTWKNIVFLQSSSASVLEHCVVERANNCGLRLETGQVTLRHCDVRNCSVTSSPVGAEGGGALYADVPTGDLVIEHCRFYDNEAVRGYGGGLHIKMGTGELVMRDCWIARNRTTTEYPNYAELRGGGLWLAGDSDFVRCSFWKNSNVGYEFSSPDSNGGGIFVASGTSTWRACSVWENAAVTRASGGSSWPTAARGGGVYLSNGDLTLQNSIVTGNDLVVTKGAPTTHHAGGIYAAGGTLTLRNCTLANNHRESLRGPGAVDARNSIFYDNSNTSLPSGTFEYCCIEGWTGGGTNFDGPPQFPTPEREIITTGSACQDAGDPSILFADSALVSLAAPVNLFGPSLGTSTCDVGAHGGPGADDWNPAPAELRLELSPADVSGGGIDLDITISGAEPFSFIGYAIVAQNGIALTQPTAMWLQIAYPDRHLGGIGNRQTLSIPAGLPPGTLTIQAGGLSSRGGISLSSYEVLTH